jgi:hypothetical protein
MAKSLGAPTAKGYPASGQVLPSWIATARTRNRRDEQSTADGNLTGQI